MTCYPDTQCLDVRVNDAVRPYEVAQSASARSNALRSAQAIGSWRGLSASVRTRRPTTSRMRTVSGGTCDLGRRRTAAPAAAGKPASAVATSSPCTAGVSIGRASARSVAGRAPGLRGVESRAGRPRDTSSSTPPTTRRPERTATSSNIASSWNRFSDAGFYRTSACTTSTRSGTTTDPRTSRCGPRATRTGCARVTSIARPAPATSQEALRPPKEVAMHSKVVT